MTAKLYKFPGYLLPDDGVSVLEDGSSAQNVWRQQRRGKRAEAGSSSLGLKGPDRCTQKPTKRAKLFTQSNDLRPLTN